MEPYIIALIGGLFGGGVLGTAVAAYFNRKQAKADVSHRMAETEETQAKTRRDEVEYYQKQGDRLSTKMLEMEAEVKQLKAAIETAQTKYEQRVGELHIKIDALASELKRANDNLDSANKTIKELRDEVKAGNQTILDLRGEVTTLLVQLAKKEG